MTDLKLKVSGLKCSGCIARAKEALSRLPGYVDAEFDLGTGRGVVHGDVDPQAAIQALGALGYTAAVKQD